MKVLCRVYPFHRKDRGIGKMESGVQGEELILWSELLIPDCNLKSFQPNIL
jgi:hypothetical protein